MESANQFAKKR